MDGVVARGLLTSYGLRVPTRVTATMPAAHELAAAAATSGLGVCLLVVLSRSRAQAAGQRHPHSRAQGAVGLAAASSPVAAILATSKSCKASHTAASSLALKHSN